MSQAVSSSNVQEKLERLSPGAVQCYKRFIATGSDQELGLLVTEVLKYHLPKTLSSPPPATWPDDARIVEDLGFDSLAMIEMVFFVEDLFQISVSNAEIIGVKTVGDLRSFVRTKIVAFKA